MFCTARWFGVVSSLVLSVTFATSTACAGSATERAAQGSERDTVTDLADGVMGAFGRTRTASPVQHAAVDNAAHTQQETNAGHEAEEIIVVYASRAKP